MPPQILRPYQQDALDRCRQEFAAGHKRVLLVASTGSGKTTIAASMIHSACSLGHRVLFLAHRRELIAQAANRLREHDIDPGIILAGVMPHPSRPVQVASVQTLARRDIPRSDLLIVDECHHSPSVSYRKSLDSVEFALGLTATPWRMNGRGLGDIFQSSVVAALPSRLVADGYLCPVDGFSYDLPDMSKVKVTGGDYSEGEAANVMGYVGGNIVQRWLDCRPGRTVLFACTVDHSQKLTRMFRDAGVRAEHLDGKTPNSLRADILGRLADGTTEIICNVGVLTEGYDLPSIRCIVLARPTRSEGLFVQMAGRGLRTAPGKDVVRIHDHAGCCMRFGLPDQDRDYSLTGGKKKDADSVPAVTTCPQCFAVFRPGPKACPACGAQLSALASPRTINEVEGVEVELSALQAKLDRRHNAPPHLVASYKELMDVAAQKGYKAGWPKVQFRLKHGFWPRKEWTDE